MYHPKQAFLVPHHRNEPTSYVIFMYVVCTYITCRPQVRRRRLLYLVEGRRRVDISPIIRLALLYLSYYYDYCHTTGALICTTLFSDSFGLFKNPRCIITVTVKKDQKKKKIVQ